MNQRRLLFTDLSPRHLLLIRSRSRHRIKVLLLVQRFRLNFILKSHLRIFLPSLRQWVLQISPNPACGRPCLSVDSPSRVRLQVLPRLKPILAVHRTVRNVSPSKTKTKEVDVVFLRLVECLVNLVLF